jgi:hypothetical protein
MGGNRERPLKTKRRGNDFPPNTHQNRLWKTAFVTVRQPAQNLNFTRRSKSRRAPTLGEPNLIGKRCPAHDCVMEHIVNSVYFPAQSGEFGVVHFNSDSGFGDVNWSCQIDQINVKQGVIPSWCDL